MRKKSHFTYLLPLFLSLIVSGCSTLPTPVATGNVPVQAVPPADVNPSPTDTPAGAIISPTATPTDANVSPTEVPAAALLPSQDVQALFTKLIDTIPATKGYGYIQADALKANLAFTDKPFLVDVRDSAELQKSGYIEGAVNIPVRMLLSNLDKLPGRNSNIVIYSNSGYRSGMALAALVLLGYTNVHDLAGGISSWIHTSNYPVVTGRMPPAPQVLTPIPVISDKATYDMLGAFLSNLPDNYYQITPIQLSQELVSSTPPTLIDMNTADDHIQYGYIKGSVNIPFSNFFTMLDKLPTKGTPIVIYAVGGGHSSIIIMGLREMGYTNVFNLQGGIIGWKNTNLPVEYATSK